MIKPRRRPTSTRVIRGSFAGQVPGVVEAYVLTLIQQAMEKADDLEAHALAQKIRYGVTIEHVPTRDEFEKAFVSRRAHPAEVKVDPKTDRVYIVGLGLPGREELSTRRVPVKNRFGETEFYDLQTESDIKYDTILTYTEVTWSEYRAAHDLIETFDPFTKQGLARYFQMPPHYLPGLVLATPGFDEDDYHRIAMYANDPRTGG